MQIHVINPGDTLWDIANQYSVSLDRLIFSNQIMNPENLVVGQTLVIPIYGSYYWVQEGDTLTSIANQFGITVQELFEINNIYNPDLIYVGTRLYIPQKERYEKEVGAYVDIMYQPNKEDIVQDVARYLSSLSIFSYEANKDGTLTPIDDSGEIEVAYSENVRPLMVITNLEDGQFSTELATHILTNEEVQDKLLDEAISIMKEKGYVGLDFDFEYLGTENRDRYVAFLEKARDRLHENGFTISAALPPKTSDDQEGLLYEGHDYEAIGEIVDYVFVMTYEWGWSGGPPMAVAPIDKVTEVMEYAVSRIDKDKILMGIPLYGYDWTLPYEVGNTWAKAISPQEAIQLALKYNQMIEYDEESQAPTFKYIDENGKIHEVWFEDARSIQAKFDLVKSLGIKGFYYWQLGFDFPQNWLLVTDNFIVNK